MSVSDRQAQAEARRHGACSAAPLRGGEGGGGGERGGGGLTSGVYTQLHFADFFVDVLHRMAQSSAPTTPRAGATAVLKKGQARTWMKSMTKSTTLLLYMASVWKLVIKNEMS